MVLYRLKPALLGTLVVAFHASTQCAFSPVSSSRVTRSLLRHHSSSNKSFKTERRSLSQLHSTTATITSMWSSATSSDWLPLYLSTVAGASTCLGAAVVFLLPGGRVGDETMSFSLALAASVMITVSVLSLGPECLRDPSYGGTDFHMMPLWSTLFLERVVSFLLGCLVYRLLSYFAFPEPEELVLELAEQQPQEEETFDVEQDKLAPVVTVESSSSSIRRNERIPHKVRSRRSTATTLAQSRDNSPNISMSSSWDDSEHYQVEQQQEDTVKLQYMPSTLSEWSSGQDLTGSQRRAWRVCMLLFFSLLIHNFPEGLAVAASALESTSLGFAVTIGIMIHNIPEGIAIAVPCLAARPHQPWLAFVLASASGLAEPLGACFTLVVLKNQSRLELENVLAFVAGIMVMVALWELFPEAKRHERPGYLMGGTLCGVLVMVATELYLP